MHIVSFILRIKVRRRGYVKQTNSLNAAKAGCL